MFGLFKKKQKIVDSLEVEKPLEDGVQSLESEVQDVFNYVQSHHDQNSNKISLKPQDYKNYYEHISDPIEKTEVMVIEYLQNLRKQDENYDYCWSYEGLNSNQECTYKINTKKVKSFVGDDSDYINNIENLTLIIDYFMRNHINVGYQFTDVFSGRWVQFASLDGESYKVEIILQDDDIDYKNIESNARKIFKDYEVPTYRETFRKDITNNPKGGVLFLLDSFFNVYKSNRVRFGFTTYMKEELGNCEYNVDDLNFVFDEYKYRTELRNKLINDELISIENTSIEIPKKENKSRRISQEVKDKVWRRDEGKCIECGSNQFLEFDHIIPHSKGGANSYRNIQLLCEACNRSKSDKIG